jgi:predicted acetyltransferase
MTTAALELPTEDPSVYLRELSGEADDIVLCKAITEDPNYSDNFGNTMTKHLGTVDQVKQSRIEGAVRGALRMGIWKDGEFAGLISASPNTENYTEAEIGYFIRKSHKGKGLATLALKTFTPHATTRFTHLYADVHVNHVASTRVLQKAGYRQTEIGIKDWGLARRFVPTDESTSPMLAN